MPNVCDNVNKKNKKSLNCNCSGACHSLSESASVGTFQGLAGNKSWLGGSLAVRAVVGLDFADLGVLGGGLTGPGRIKVVLPSLTCGDFVPVKVSSRCCAQVGRSLDVAVVMPAFSLDRDCERWIVLRMLAPVLTLL